MENASTPVTFANTLFETLCQLGSATPAAWLDCATRCEIAASLAAFASTKRSLRARADECRARARRAALPVIDVCPGCSEPAHASETNDDGLHPECVAA